MEYRQKVFCPKMVVRDTDAMFTVTFTDYLNRKSSKLYANIQTMAKSTSQYHSLRNVATS